MELARGGPLAGRGAELLANANNSQYDNTHDSPGNQALSDRKPLPTQDREAPAPAGAPAAGPVRIASRALFGDASLVLIEHEGETYSLRRTRLGKLILTK
ncbi:MAG: hemin uptake protein HemP [Burkholderiales bacterium]|jgi:hemin uptake protein HemP|nr:hemin uptake protein HemP [Burkholderiales bacterium]MBZ0249822.1 hemin uptake protein HemP [Burkholderiales bacterium]MCL4687709.1 hemin uptake protein HemP [Burkholderiales bacterium]